MREIMLRSASASERPRPRLIALLPHRFWALVLLGVLPWLGLDAVGDLLRRVDKVGIELRPCPMHAFGITDRPDQPIHLVLHALARLRS